MRQQLFPTACLFALLATSISAFSADTKPAPTQPQPLPSPEEKIINISGRYPHLAMFNHQGECGTGAVAPWADRLWVITYGPHLLHGSDDKLYEIDADLHRVIRPGSVGGTPADRMIHRETKQLIIGPYFIDAQRNVRVVMPDRMPGRITAAARHLTDPAHKVYFVMMEGDIWEVDVQSLAATRLFEKPVPGWHGKGAYTAQGRLVVANNGAEAVGGVKPHFLAEAKVKNPAEDAGVLAEWDNKNWRVLERRQFTDVTSPGGIEGAPDDNAPLWAIGWDKRSLILKVLDAGKWHAFRLPKADQSYDPKHGWFTEWPRIREIAPGKLLMNMHGGWFDFPKTMSAANYGGLRPIGAYLKITGDFAPWKDGIVFGCDDASVMQNPLAGQSDSNLWFATRDDLEKCGRPSGWGGPWVGDDVKAGEPSAPFLFAGYEQRVLHLAHELDDAVAFDIETDADGRGKWTKLDTVSVPAHGYAYHIFPATAAGEWVRLKTDRDCKKATAYFNYGPGGGATTQREMFAALANGVAPWSGGIVLPRGGDRGTLLFKSQPVQAAGQPGTTRWFEVRPDMTFHEITEPAQEAAKDKPRKADPEVSIDDASVIVTQGKTRYRLPKSDAIFDQPGVAPPHIREVVTERALLNAHGTFYMLPRDTAGGALNIKPICTHDKMITDFCSWRGLLVLAGTRADAKPDGHFFASKGAPAGLWFGDIDDLWKLGKPRGHGGPWKDAAVKAGEPSDPYLMAGYDKKSLTLSHDAKEPVTFSVEVDFVADGTWHEYAKLTVKPGETLTHDFPEGYSAHWVRLRTDRDAKVAATFTYGAFIPPP
jgi:hypothetical protein